ncbi:MAG TPA: glycosyltransferase family 2 protein [Clostridia bacterium]|nr:glycosyltransferase family 2 protein [Clostridia bacterium]
MLFSVLIPVYNISRYLPECVKSALSQSEQDFELVLVDDGSTDGSGQLCDQYQVQHPDRVRVIHQPNSGLILARRAGIAAAKGDYCIFLDGDDALEPDCLATVRETIARYHADIVIYNNVSFFEDDRTREPNAPVFADGTVFCGDDKRRIYRELIASWRLNNIWTKAIKTELLRADDTPYERFATNPHTEDLLQTLYPVTHANCIVYCTKELYLYRRHSRSMTQKLELSQITRLYNAAVQQQLRAYMTQWGMDSQEELDLFNARKVNALLTLFWQYYRGTKGAKQKQIALNYNWGALLDEESRDFSKNAKLSRVRRMQMHAVLTKQRVLLDCFAWFGGIRMRAKHGA